MSDIIAEAVSNSLETGFTEEADLQIKKIEGLVSSIKDELEIIESNFKLVQKNTGRKQRLLKYLNETYVSSYTDDLRKNSELSAQIITSVSKLYFLTEQYFELLGLIRHPTFMMTAIVGDMYIRKDFSEDLLKNSSNFLFIEEESRSGGFGLRFRTSAVIEQLQNSIKKNEEEQQTAKALFEHYQEFVKPLVETDSGLNQGVLREAFERHLENLHNSMRPGDKFNSNCKMESVAERWFLYRISSGSDPYFTGPDTELSQVKAETASLVSNVSTVLNTARYIVQNDINLDNMRAALKTQGESEIRTFSKKIWDSLKPEVKSELEQVFIEKLGKNGTMAVGKNTIRFKSKKS